MSGFLGAREGELLFCTLRRENRRFIARIIMGYPKSYDVLYFLWEVCCRF